MSAIRNSILTQFPPATRGLSLALVLTSVVLLALRSGLTREDLKQISYGGQDATLAFPWLVAVPGKVPLRPWTLLTAAFVEINLIELVITTITLALGGRYLERVWGYVDFLKFCAVSIIIPNAIAVGVNFLEGFALGDQGQFLYGQSYHGMMALQTAFLVAFTQIIPEHQIQFFGGIAKLKVKQLPMLYVTLSNVMCIIGYQSPFILIQFGWLVSWAYLRFIKDGGDRSETFAFASWFPPFIQKYVNQVANLVFNTFVRLRILKPWTDLEQGIASPPGNARAEAERRRAMALQALDQRLASSNKQPPVPKEVAVPQPVASASATSQQQPTPKRTVSTSGAPQIPTSPTAPSNNAAADVVFDADKE